MQMDSPVDPLIETPFQKSTGGASEPPKQIGRYEILNLLGSGGMGEVYRAYDPVLKRNVALKLIRWQAPELIERFEREAQAQARVEHDNVCRVYEVGVADNRQYIAMQLIEGKTLNEVAPQMTLEEKVRGMKQVA